MLSFSILRPAQIFLAGLMLTAPMRAATAPYTAPAYTPEGIVNAASYSAGALAPNTIASIFGTSLSFETQPLTKQQLVNGGLPTALGGVTVYVGGSMAGLYYVSATQINFLIPNVLLPGPTNIVVVREGFAGPTVQVTLSETAPGFFTDAGYNVIATHADGSLIESSAPAASGEWIVLWVEGLGRTVPDQLPYALPDSVAPIAQQKQFALTLDGNALDPVADIYYAGIAPPYAGLYQINMKVPAGTAANPEIQMVIGSAVSANHTHLFVH